MRVNANHTVTPTDDGAVILDRRAGEYWQVNRTAAYVLTRIGEGAPESTVVAELQQQHPDHHDNIGEDVRGIVAEFQQAGVVSDE